MPGVHGVVGTRSQEGPKDRMDAKVVLEKRPVKTKFIWNISVYDLPFVIMLVMDGFIQVIEVTAMGQALRFRIVA